jgi:hypothetical protein
MVFRVFYEAARDLDSPPPSQTDRVEACRPRGCLPSQSSGAHDAGHEAHGKAGGPPLIMGGAARTKNDAAPGRFEDSLHQTREPGSAGGAASHLMASLFAARFRV